MIFSNTGTTHMNLVVGRSNIIKYSRTKHLEPPAPITRQDLDMKSKLVIEIKDGIHTNMLPRIKLAAIIAQTAVPLNAFKVSNDKRSGYTHKFTTIHPPVLASFYTYPYVVRLPHLEISRYSVHGIPSPWTFRQNDDDAPLNLAESEPANFELLRVSADFYTLATTTDLDTKSIKTFAAPRAVNALSSEN